jgi:polysaccharide export outer membrane protein
MNASIGDPRQGRLARRLALAATLLACLPGSAAAQDVLGMQRRQATRAELEQAIAGAEAVSATADPKTREKLAAHVASIRQRLRNGDFAPGDRLYLTVLGDSSLTDTFTVRTDQRLQLPNIPEISLRGVLDSELSSHLSKELSRYLKDPQVTATGLIRLSVMGAIGEPGFLTVPIDQLVTDVLMAAGGPAQTGKFEEAHVKRAGKTYLDRKQFAEAIRSGKTVGDVSLRDGDEIYIPQASTSNFFQVWMPVLSASIAVFWIIRGGRGRRVP